MGHSYEIMQLNHDQTRVERPAFNKHGEMDSVALDRLSRTLNNDKLSDYMAGTTFVVC
jgi:hypothetical protein